MEFVEGIKVTDKQGLIDAGIDYSRLMERLMRVFNKMILAYRFFHADPHPGNIFVTRESDGLRTVLHYFGHAPTVGRSARP